MKRYSNSLFLYRRDLRIDDNTGLQQALSLSAQVLPAFIFDPRQINPHPYQSKPALRFMLQAITDLQKAFLQIGSELALYEGLPDIVLPQLIERCQLEAIFVNRDYTPFSQKRDAQLAQVCQQHGIAFHCVADALLNEPESVVKLDGKPYQVFTAYYNHARKIPVMSPSVSGMEHYFRDKQQSGYVPALLTSTQPYSEAKEQGGRQQAIDLLEQLTKQQEYQQHKDYPYLAATSQLSVHLKFGTCSVREVYWVIVQTLGQDHPLIRQLYWRDFFTHIAFHFPRVFSSAFLAKFNALIWDNNREKFQRWADGTTGFPIVDAGMRELNTTGFMHNRVRMIVASFLVKDLHISWRWGERYFAQHLVDYDPCVNNGNWQWAASTGCDAQPYFRIFNPWLQQRKFDPNCCYIYRWLPELKQVPVYAIHNWQSCAVVDGNYPAPILNHAEEAKISLARYKAAALN